MRNLWLAFAAAFAVMAWGFWPSTLAGGAPPLDGLRIVHGALAATWMATVVMQSWLAGRRRIGWHRRIGWASFAIVPALVVSSLLVVQDEVRHSTYFPRALRLTLTWLDLTALAVFVLLWAAAIATRRRWPLHARWMGCTVLVVLPPALGRLIGPWAGGLRPALPWSFAIVCAILAGLIGRDVARRGHPLPYAVTFAGIALPAATMFVAPGRGWLAAVAQAMGPLG